MLVTSEFLCAQWLEVKPIPGSSGTHRKGNSNSRIKNDVPVSLPFWDDFSTISPGYPDTLWVNSRSVYISDGVGINPPSINVAVFNGLDSLGSPYSPNELTAVGFTDKLESRKIKMSEVPGGQRNSVYLSFFYQWQGNAEAPDANDFLRLEFRNDAGNWETIETIYGEDLTDNTVFQLVNFQVSGTRFFHDDFQFRLRSFGRQSGPFDTWLVDYIYLNAGRSQNDNSFPDRAAASTLSRLFKEYYAAPVKHFFLNKKLDSVRFDVQNLRGPAFGGASINYRANARFLNYIGEDPPIQHAVNLINSRGVKGETGAMLPFERVSVRLDTLPDVDDPLQFNPDADLIEVQLKMRVISSDSIDPELPLFLPLDFRVNDTISTTYTLKDYYAYDDGGAEYSVGLTQPGNRLAYRFDMLIDTATLNGFEIYFPYLGGANTQTLDLFILSDDDGKPFHIPLYNILSRTITMNTQNQFMYIPIEPLFIQDSVFYIGYRQPVSGRINVGLDKSNDTGEKIFVFVNGEWLQNTDVSGSLMIRPVFGKGSGDIVTHVPGERRTAAPYPNPNNGVFYLSDEVHQIEILDVTGRTVDWTMHDESTRKRISITSPTSGMYIIRWASRQGLHIDKVLVR